MGGGWVPVWAESVLLPKPPLILRPGKWQGYLDKLFVLASVKNNSEEGKEFAPFDGGDWNTEPATLIQAAQRRRDAAGVQVVSFTHDAEGSEKLSLWLGRGYKIASHAAATDGDSSTNTVILVRG